MIEDPRTLETLRTERTLRRTVSRIAIRSRTAGAIHPLEAALNRHYFACGCAQGAVGVYLGAAVATAMWLGGFGLAEWRWWNLASVALGCSLVGKLAGIMASRWRLRTIYRELGREFGYASAGPVNVASSGAVKAGVVDLRCCESTQRSCEYPALQAR